MTTDRFLDLLKHDPLPQPRITHPWASLAI